MKVLNIIHRYPPGIGGSEIWCRNLCLFLAKKGVVTAVASINMYNVAEAYNPEFSESSSLNLGNEDCDGGVYIRRYKLWKPWADSISARILHFFIYTINLQKTELGEIFKISPHSFEMYNNLGRDIKKSDMVVLHTLPYFHNLIGYALARFYKRLVICVPHFHPGHPHYEKRVLYKLMNKCDAVIAVSEYEKDYLIKRGIRSEKVFVSGNAVCEPDTDNSDVDICHPRYLMLNKYGIKEKAKKVIFVGRKEVYKGILDLIEAMRRISIELDMGLFLFLVGPSTPDFDKRHKGIGDLGRLKVIDFGEVSDAEKNYLLQMSDLLALPSEFEAFGIVFLEAWKHAKPVIGSDRGAMPEVIGNGGLSFEYGNVDDLKDKIKRLLFDKKLSDEMGKAGRERLLRNYSIEKVYGRVLDVFRDLAKDKKRILMVSQLFPPHGIGGAEIVAYEQAKALKTAGFKVRIFAGKINDTVEQFSVTKEKGEFEITRINMHRKDFEHHANFNFNNNRLREIFRKALYEYAPDVIHFHNIYAFPVNMIDDCIDMGIPMAMTLHDYNGICPRNILVRDDGDICNLKNGEYEHCQEDFISENGDKVSVKERNSIYISYYNKVNLLISPSMYLAKRYIERGLDQRNIEVINNGVYVSLFSRGRKTRSRKIRFGYVGQILWHKGIENMLIAASLLNNEERKRAAFLIFGFGDNAFLDYCKTMSKGMGCVSFLGGVSYTDVPDIFKKIDILIVPSIWPENSPHTIMEAMASGTPVIASNLGGIPELIDNGINGLLFEHNNPNSLLEKIRYLIDNPEKIEYMRKNCLARIAEIDITKHVDRIVGCYHKIIRKGRIYDEYKSLYGISKVTTLTSSCPAASAGFIQPTQLDKG